MKLILGISLMLKESLIFITKNHSDPSPNQAKLNLLTMVIPYSERQHYIQYENKLLLDKILFIDYSQNRRKGSYHPYATMNNIKPSLNESKRAKELGRIVESNQVASLLEYAQEIANSTI